MGLEYRGAYRIAETEKISEDRKSAGGGVFAGSQAQKKTSVDVFR
jgi:hypothetical protein